MRFFIALSISAAVILVGGSASPDFTNIDCGSSEKYRSDEDTRLIYVNDDEYVDSGINREIDQSYKDEKPGKASNVRSFPNGVRNCYRITGSITEGYKYLIRASFLYGNYDGNDSVHKGRYITFDLYLGVDLWQTMNITNPSQLYTAEVITLATSNSFFVCLIRTGNGIPFISALELRPIDNSVYSDVNQAVSLRLLGRTNMGSPIQIRYPDDDYDRIWSGVIEPCTGSGCSRVTNRPVKNSINTTFQVVVNSSSRDHFKVNSKLMETAAKAQDNITLVVNFSEYINGVVSTKFYVYLHFAELQNIQGNESRKFQVVIPGHQHTMNTVPSPEYLVASNFNIIQQYGPNPSNYYLNLTRVSGSKFPPILNAVEAYAYINLTSIATDQRDVDAMMSIKKLYGKSVWQGDPCLPENFSWGNITCNCTSAPPRIISLNLSNSGLKDPIPYAIVNLTAVKNIDLSNNSFTDVPPFLAKLPSLETLDLSNNRVNDNLPVALCDRQAKGLLLRMAGNPCSSNGLCVCGKQKSGTIIPIIIPVLVVLVVLLIIQLIFLLRRKRKKRQQYWNQKLKLRYLGDGSFHCDNPHFTYQDLRTITNNFERVIGKGGFATVYYGRLTDGTEVAVKMQKRFLAIGEGSNEDLKVGNITPDSHGFKEFQVEAQLLTRVHHRNLVSLVGYCKDGNSLGLVFEYVAQGSLRDHLSETENGGKIFNWRERLRIAIDAAQGLEYLHKGCKPTIIHRDVKTSNILLSHNFEAKIADFGLSKAFLTDGYTHVSTEVVAGTPGYVDPEYHSTFRLSEKSDVYSFGIVLLELVTGLPAVLKLPETGHILQWVRQRLINGNVADVADLRLKCQYDVHSMRMVTDLALHCTVLDGIVRPTMTEVVMQLKESLQLEMHRENSSLISYGESFYSSTSGAREITSLEITEMSGPGAR